MRGRGRQVPGGKPGARGQMNSTIRMRCLFYAMIKNKQKQKQNINLIITSPALWDASDLTLIISGEGDANTSYVDFDVWACR
jgi:hypothetical protein